MQVKFQTGSDNGSSPTVSVSVSKIANSFQVRNSPIGMEIEPGKSGNAANVCFGAKCNRVVENFPRNEDACSTIVARTCGFLFDPGAFSVSNHR